MQPIPDVALARCGRCGADNPGSNRFCGTCGANLAATLPIDTPALDQRVRAFLTDHLRDQKAVEIEITQAIADRLTNWAKLFGFWAAVLLGILAAILASWGITDFVSFKNAVRSAESETKNVEERAKDAQTKLQTAMKQMGTLPDDVSKVRAQVDALNAQLGSVPQQISTLQSKVNRIEERIGFEKTSALTPQLENQLASALSSFHDFCRKAGFSVRPGTPKVRVEEVPTIKGKPVEGAASFYLPDTGEMVIARQYASDPTFVLREYMHRLLLAPDLSAAVDGYYGVESGLACYYPASYQGFSKCAFYDLKDQTPFTAPYLPNTWGIQTWGSAFWELRGILGATACDRLLVKIWSELDPHHPNADYSRYVASLLLAAYREGGGADFEKVREIFLSRSLFPGA
jgi:hypothetical protein